jgi:ABC-type multidrug transport system fused ATPase/permease subunit
VTDTRLDEGVAPASARDPRGGASREAAATSEPTAAIRAQSGGPKPAKSPFAKGMFAYIWHISGRSQVLLILLSIVLFLLDLAPLELQRRIVNDAIDHHVVASLIWLCGSYCVVAVLLGITKLTLNIYRSRVGEAANRRLRLDTYGTALHHAEPEATGQEGVGISIILSEIDPVGGFIGMSFSEPVLHGGVLISVFCYLLYLQPWMALVGLALFAPQFVFVPLIQNAINERTKSRIQTTRELSVDIVNETAEGAAEHGEDTYRDRVGTIYRLNMQIFRRKFAMNFLMNLLHHLGVVGILFVGGLLVLRGSTEVGTVVAFISGLNQVNDPWGDMVNYFQNMTNARVKYGLIARVLDPAAAPDAVAQQRSA